MGDLSIDEGDSSMDGNQPASDGAGRIDRRTLLKLTGGAAGGSLTVTAVGSAKNSNANGKGNGGGKSGGRGHTSSPVRVNEPFTLTYRRRLKTDASCMSSNSADQWYIQYWLDYCDWEGPENPEKPPEDWTICVIPDDSEVNEDRVYEFRSKQECKSSNQEFQHKFSFGPSNSDC